MSSRNPFTNKSTDGSPIQKKVQKSQEKGSSKCPRARKVSGELGKLAKSRRAEIPRKEKQYVIMKVFLVELEPAETRYTAQWKTHLPKQMKQAGLDVEVIPGPEDAPRYNRCIFKL